MNDPILVTSPLLPPLGEFIPYLEDIWTRKWLTNNGYYHQQLEMALCEYLGIEHLSLFTNGTLPLTCSLQMLGITGEVITTPYSFVATSHAILLNGTKPVFVDIDPVYGNIDPDKIEAAITNKTTAIMPVHVYGNPCDTGRIQAIADKHGLKVIYDAAHTFGVTVNGQSILKAGDMSTLSFHATKTYNTIEGGALICKTAEMKKQVDYIKNFGFVNETTVVAAGSNGKLDEIRAAYGLLSLKHVDDSIDKRRQLASFYKKTLKNTSGVSFIDDIVGVRHNYSYFPIFVDEEKYGMSRDALYKKLKDNNIFGRRYFYPLISEFHMYNELDSANKENLPVAYKKAKQVLCLPMYSELNIFDAERIMSLITK